MAIAPRLTPLSPDLTIRDYERDHFRPGCRSSELREDFSMCSTKPASVLSAPLGGSMTREEVCARIDGERAYQIFRWAGDKSGGMNHSPIEWLVFMRHYIEVALARGSTEASESAFAVTMADIRKITALGVAALEEYGCVARRPV